MCRVVDDDDDDDCWSEEVEVERFSVKGNGGWWWSWSSGVLRLSLAIFIDGGIGGIGGIGFPKVLLVIGLRPSVRLFIGIL